MNNVCANSECGIALATQGIFCKQCNSKFGSTKCIGKHNENDHSTIKKPMRFHSKFLKKGKIIEHKRNSFYDIENFQYNRNPKTNKLIILGAGSFGNVYLATHTKENKYYAIKHCLKENIISSGQDIEIIKREISIHQNIHHPNIVKMYEYKEDSKNFFMILEYMPSGTLFSLIRKRKGLSEMEAYKYFIQVVSAIVFLHENGYAHRDLKPENMLLDEKGNLKLCDFGWCVNITMGERGTFCGTYEYMAPEILKEQPYTLSIDIWSLGILLYELIHGYSPFRATKNKGNGNYEEVFKNIVKHDFTIEKEMSEECEDLIKKLLTKNYRARINIEDLCKHPWIIKMEEKYMESEMQQNDHFPQMENDKCKGNKNLNSSQKENDIRKINEDSNKKKNDLKGILLYNNEDNLSQDIDNGISSEKHRKRKNKKSNTNQKKQQLNDSENEDNLIEKRKNSLKIEESNDFCLFRNSQKNSSKEDQKTKIYYDNNNFQNDIISSFLSKSTIDRVNNKNEKLYIEKEEETPTPQQYMRVKTDNNHKESINIHNGGNYMNVMEEARNNKKEIQIQYNHQSKKKQSFLDKFFSTFRCDENNNYDN